MRHDDDPLPRKPSSWSAAIAQLPGFPEEAKPKLPPIADGKARAVSSGMSDDDEASEQTPRT
ncbi:MAG TPA: hypothetical protein VE325_08085 [Burkholderiales bacterium]|jgi:hypothetical protein|nr:hypothetical protein [Burkholderiales bacterium]